MSKESNNKHQGDSIMEMEMKTISKHIVKPAEPTFNGLLPLSQLDFCSLTHAYYVYLYDKPIQQSLCDLSTTKIINILKDSLSRALVPFYPLAGRLSWIGGGRVKLECNAMGAELIHVESPSTMQKINFGDFNTSSRDIFPYLVPKMDYCGVPIYDLPLLAVQVTRFACGGLSLGFAISHVVGDGCSLFHFTKEWARLARGEPLEVAPFLDRQILHARDVGEVDHDGADSMDYFRKIGYGQVGDNVTPTFKVLTNDEIEQLKQTTNNANNDGFSYSRFEVITAYVWRWVCKVRELKSEEVTTLVVVVNARSRVDPPLPSSYFGNATVVVRISCLVSELMSKPLCYACSKIREETTKVNNNSLFEDIEFLKSQKSLINYQNFDDRGKTHAPLSEARNKKDVAVISWLNLGCSGIDFGWGKETYMGAPVVHGCDGYFMISPYKINESVMIGLFLQPAAIFRSLM